MYPEVNENSLQDWQSVDKRLSKIMEFIGSELKLKQEMIRLMTSQAEEMASTISDRDEEISQLRERLRKSCQDTEGLHQLMNKLLNDVENYQKDIDWYRRTYEQRSLLGILKDKFFRKPEPGDK